MIIRKLLIIIMGIFLVLTAGVCNLYPIYLSKIRHKFNFTIKEVNLYGTFINIGLWVAFPMGYIYDKLGPKISCCIGALLLSGSYLALYFILDSTLQNINLAFLLIIGLTMGQGSALCYTTSVTTNLKNFRFKESSSVVGLLVANLALSPSIFTTYKEYFEDLKFFLGISIFSFVVILFSGLIFQNIRRVYSEEESQKTYEKYKEKKIIKLLIIINLIILIVYTFSVIYNHMQENRIPLVILYPCLQSLNFIVILLEKTSIFDKIYFSEYVNKKLATTNALPLKPNNSILSIINNTNTIFQRPDSKKNSAISNIGNESSKNLENIIKENEMQTPKYRNSYTIRADADVYNKEDNKNPNFSGDNDYTSKLGFDGIKKDSLKSNINKEVSICLPSIIIKDLNGNINADINDETKMEEINLNESTIKRKNSMSFIEENESSNNNKKDISDNQQANNNNQTTQPNEAISNGNSGSIAGAENENTFVSMKTAVTSKEFFYLILILIFGIGSVIANLNNIQFIYESIIIPNASKAAETNDDMRKTILMNVFQYVILYFVFNSFTRIISGLVLDYLIKIKKFINFLLVISCLGFISQIFGLFMNKYLLYVSICLAGATHGGYMTFTPIYVRNEYGLKNMGKILGLLTTGCALGSFIIADFIFTIFYESQAVKTPKKNLNDKDTTDECYGEKCFRYSYLISSILFLINIVLSYYIYKRYAKKHFQ